MKFKISDDALKNTDLKLEEVIVLLLYHLEPSGPFNIIQTLVNKGYLIGTGPAYKLTNKAIVSVNQITTESEERINKHNDNERFLRLAKDLKEIYPKGKNSGGYYWAEGVSVISTRLKQFVAKYGDHTDEEIKTATEKYVQENSNNRFMKTLRYFIFRSRTFAGDKEPESMLLTYIENIDEGKQTNLDWRTRIV